MIVKQVGIVVGIAFANLLTAPSFNLLGSATGWMFILLTLFASPNSYSVLKQVGIVVGVLGLRVKG